MGEEERLIDNLQKHAEKVRDDVVEKKRREEALRKTTAYATVIDKIIEQLGTSGGEDVLLEETASMCFTVNTEKVSTAIPINIDELLKIADRVPALLYTRIENSTKKVFFGFVEKTE